MGFSSPLHNVKGFSASRPPVVIFVVCLIAFACATLAMAFFIDHTEIVANPEVKGNWKKFLDSLSSLNLCASVNEVNRESDVSDIFQFMDDSYNSTGKSVARITLQASIKLTRELKRLPANNMVAVSGSFEIDGWAKHCYDKSLSPSLVNISFVIPEDLTESDAKEVCILITGPIELSPFGTRSSFCSPSLVNKTITHVGSIRSVNPNKTDPFCREGSSLRLNYSNELNEEFFLSKQERWIIYFRLIHASYFLFVIAVTFVFYSLIRGRQNNSLPTIDKIPLTL